jgi:lipopolysaccharide transport system ATP-binding protein
VQDFIASILGQEYGDFEFMLPTRTNGQYAVMASVADGTLYKNVQHHWMHDTLIINASSSKV